uniref:Glycosyltransferase 2-like domain-containing protein n=1 Tax=Sinocyclocheilus anshuiensis TaxID=1608454 RepID=A0A671Q1K5_9TELE
MSKSNGIFNRSVTFVLSLLKSTAKIEIPAFHLFQPKTSAVHKYSTESLMILIKSNRLFRFTVLMGYPDLCHVNRSQTPFSPHCFAGLAKPMGLVEGPGGLGQGGAAATLGEDSRESEGRYEEYGYNAQLSDRISLDRNIPDYRPKKCKQLTYSDDLPQISVVFIFVNEALSVILRSVHSVVNHTPAHLLKEIILVDDNMHVWLGIEGT